MCISLYYYYIGRSGGDVEKTDESGGEDGDVSSFYSVPKDRETSSANFKSLVRVSL